MWSVDLDLEGGFPEAVAWFRARVPMTEEAFGELSARAQEKAFTVANVAQLDVVTDAWEALDKAIDEGTDLREFVADVGAQLEQAWGGEDPARLESMFRTNVQFAYAAGRTIMQDDPAIKEARPFKRFMAVLDSRTSEICSERDGTVLPADDPFWDSNNPPLHRGCRSTIITLDPEQAQEFGVDNAPPDAPDVQDGFGNPLAEWTPTLDQPAPLVAQYHAKAK